MRRGNGDGVMDAGRAPTVAPLRGDRAISPTAVMLHGTAQHYAYHAGQIALLKKLVA